MVFKLVRTDTEEPNKIQLPLGTHLIGRGKFLEVDDKRVSRNHGELQIDENTVTLKALHANPCFFLKKGTVNAELLRQGNSVVLNNGDQFGLLPDTYWYQLIYCNILDMNRNSPEISSVGNEVDQYRTQDLTVRVKNENESESNKSEQRPDSPVTQREESPSLTQREASPSLIQREVSSSLTQREESSSLMQRDSPSLMQSDESSSLMQRDSPSLMQTEEPGLMQTEEPGLMQRDESPSLTPRPESPSLTQRPESPSLISQETHSATQNNEHGSISSNDHNPQTPSKRSHSPVDSKEGIKKVKLEPVELKEIRVKQELEERQETADVRQNDDARQHDDDTRQRNDDAKPGPSNDQRGSDSADKDGMPPSPTKPKGPGRERCWYGASCYRRNPQHKLEFCHPGDADWGAGDRGACPWGSRCRRREPRHWLHHDHPPGTNPPPPQRRPVKKRRKKQRNDSDEESSDSPVQDLIVTGKRARKKVERKSWSESESNEDPFQTDESDEWQPGSQDFTQTPDF